MTPSVLWIAGPDGVAHAHLGGERWTACGASVVGQRWAWPTLTRCPSCLGTEGGANRSKHLARITYQPPLVKAPLSPANS
jgi:hypothetical protein